MHKLKTSKSVKKRFKISGTKKVLRHKTHRSHLLQKKSSKRKRKLRTTVNCSEHDIKYLKNKISYAI